ncbi:MAG: hypothetical protein ACXVJF_02610 [Acidimicrobiia bacterium]
MPHRRKLAVAAAVSMLLALAACTRFGAVLTRPSDPVVLAAGSLPKLLGGDPTHVVGFAWDGTTWHQIPVQVDERDLVNPGQIYHRPTTIWPTRFGTGTPYKILVYTPPAHLTAGYTSTPTYTPVDSDPSFDANDELSFLVSDTGREVDGSAAAPSGVDPSSREEVRTSDPLAPAGVGFVYLFHSPTLTGGSAGTTGVGYTFSLDSGDYLATYKMGAASLSPNNTWGFNPEHSSVVTPSYSEQFGDRWFNDGLTVTAGGASGAPILERTHFYATGGCGRSEDTFDGSASNPGEGAFIANISGPVRAIRSYLGANSYLYTVNTHLFYPDREDLVTDVRGHAGLPGYGVADDYVTNTSVLHYSDPSNSGVVIDGTPDTVTPIGYATGTTAPAMWQMVSGAQGSVVTVRTLDTDIDSLDIATVYQDRNPASPAQCTGDAAAWGQNGVNLTSPVNNVPVTDPTLSSTPGTLVIHRFRFFRGPELPTDSAAALDQQARTPVETTVAG